MSTVAERTWIRRVNEQNVTITTVEVDGRWRAECRSAGSAATATTEMLAIFLVEADLAEAACRVERRVITITAAVLLIGVGLWLITQAILR